MTKGDDLLAVAADSSRRANRGSCVPVSGMADLCPGNGALIPLN